jgi:predicted nucleotidyltransferase component of viral defense system
MEIIQQYKDQVSLLLDILPIVAKRKSFALKGGTALNLFIWKMPRLSVDIDLVYLPISDRDEALKDILLNLVIIKDELERVLRIKVLLTDNAKLVCSKGGTIVKIEVNTIIRGSFFDVLELEIVDFVQDEFGKFSAILTLDKAEIYGSKICAALDRQHPRDIFDVSKILDEGNGEFNKKIKEAFIFYLLSHNRPINEILFSKINDKKADFKNQFEGMAREKFDYEDFIKISNLLREKIDNLLSDKDKKFILSFKQGKPDWSLFVKDISQYPSIKWKLNNITNLLNNNPAKHQEMVEKLENLWK